MLRATSEPLEDVFTRRAYSLIHPLTALRKACSSRRKKTSHSRKGERNGRTVATHRKSGCRARITVRVQSFEKWRSGDSALESTATSPREMHHRVPE